VKHVLVIYEGAADVASDELEGSTPLQLSRSVYASDLANRGVSGNFFWSPEDHLNRTEGALALLLGVSQGEAKLLRRGPVEAASLGSASTWTYAYRGNFVTTDGRDIRENRVSGLSLDETQWLIDSVAGSMDGLPVRFALLAEGRAAVMFEGMVGSVEPGDFPSVGMAATYSEKQCVNDRRRVMMKSAETLASASINDIRVDLGENPASLLWLWAGGPPVSISMPFGGAALKTAMVTNSPLGRGLARLCGMDVLELGDVWADQTTPELVSGDALQKCIAQHTLTVVYVEAPLEGGSYGTDVEKVKALDRVDIHVLGRVHEVVQRMPETRLMLTALPPDGVWMEETPVLLSGHQVGRDSVVRFDEISSGEGSLSRLPAQRCLARLLGE